MRISGADARQAAAALLAGSTVGVLVFAVWLGLAWASLGADRDALAGRITAAFAAGDLRPTASWAFGDTDLGVHQYNDCLILYQALDDRAPARLRAISPLSVAGDAAGPCAHLQRLAVGRADMAPRFYHHYLHAATTLARLLLPALGVRGLRETYRLIGSLLLLAGIGYAMLGLARGRRRATDAVWLILFAVLARGFGLEAFGQSLGHAPADLMVLGFLLFLARGSAAAPLGSRTVLIAAAIFGALTMELELLTGGLPLGLAVVLGATPLALAPDARRAGATMLAAVAYLAAALASLLAKAVLILAVLGPGPLREAGSQVAFRAGVAGADTAARDQPAGWHEFAVRVAAGFDSLMPGMRWMATGLLLLALVGGGWGYAQLRRSPDRPERDRATALAGSNVVLLLWMVLLWQHTAEHAWFVDRILAWTLASGAALFFLAVRPGRAGSGDQPLPGAGSAR